MTTRIIFSQLLVAVVSRGNDFISHVEETLMSHDDDWTHRQAIGELVRSGCDFAPEIEKHFPSMVLVLESIRSLHLQSQGLHHNLQDFARDCIDIECFEKKMVDIDEELD